MTFINTCGEICVAANKSENTQRYHELVLKLLSGTSIKTNKKFIRNNNDDENEIYYLICKNINLKCANNITLVE